MSMERFYLEYDSYKGWYTAIGYTYGGKWIGWAAKNPLEGKDPLDEDQEGVVTPFVGFKKNCKYILHCLIDEHKEILR